MMRKNKNPRKGESDDDVKAGGMEEIIIKE